jgi:hypothetical protein
MKVSGIPVWVTFGFLSCLLGGLTLAEPLWANPRGSDPYRPLAVHGTIEEAKAMVAELYKLYQEEEQFVIESQKFRDNPTRLSDRGISKASGRIWKARRDAGHLILMGEPAGTDLTKKFSMLLPEVYKLADVYRHTPRGVQLVQKLRNERTRKAPSLKKFLQQAQGAIARGQLELGQLELGQQLEKRGIELNSQLVFFSRPEASKFYHELAGVLAKNDESLSRKRKQEYMQRATAVMNEQVAAATEFPAVASRIAREIGANGTASLNQDKKGTAPEAFSHLVTLWGHASAGLMRATAIQWAFTNRAQAEVQPSPGQFKETALQSLASIVEAAAMSTGPEEVQATYTELLKQISVADRRLGPYSRYVYDACRPALGKLAAKDPGLQARIKAYDRATSEVLRWRKDYAAQQATHWAKAYPAATTLLITKGPIAVSDRPNYVRTRQRETVTAPASFNGPANWMMLDAASRLVGKPVAEERLIRLTPSARVGVVPVDSNHYANVPVPLPTEAEVEDLRRSLVVDAEHGPLTVDSADAISSAELHDYLAVAGLIQEVHLESIVTRFAALPDVAYSLVPLGMSPQINDRIEPLQQTLWRLDVKPQWARQKYFTTRVETSAR